MSEEDRKWLEAALKQYTFNDADRLKEVCTELKNHMEMTKENVLELLDELLELVELHVRNSLNMCICGGM
jgi:Zn-dependent M16 (insulinase) family peptidase